MAHGLVGIDDAPPGEREEAPCAVRALPIERCLPGFALDGCPALRQPPFRPAIAAIGDEGEILAAGDKPRAEPERLEPNLVTRHFIVEGEAIAAITDFMQAAFDRNEGELWRAIRCRSLCGRVTGSERIERKHMLDVHEDQLLMLLLMIDAELEQRRDCAP